MLRGAVICVLDRKQSKLGTGWDSCAVISLGSLTIAKFNGVSMHCFVVALFQLCMYTTLEYIVSILLHVDNLRKH